MDKLTPDNIAIVADEAKAVLLADLPKIDAILDGSAPSFQSNISVQYAIATATAWALKDLNERYADVPVMERVEFYTAFNNAIGYMLENYSREVGVVFMRMAANTHQLPAHRRDLLPNLKIMVDKFASNQADRDSIVAIIMSLDEYNNDQK